MLNAVEDLGDVAHRIIPVKTIRRWAAMEAIRSSQSLQLRGPTDRGIESVMKAAKPPTEKRLSKPSRVQNSARCHKLTETERRKLRDEALRLYYGCEPKPAGAHRD